MVTPELIEYIKGQIAQNQTPEEIKTILLGKRWGEPDINQAFSQIGINQSSSSTVFVASSSQVEEKKPANIFDFKKMRWYEWLAMLPAFILIIQGGALGGLFGGLGWGLSLKIIRSEKFSKIVKVFLVVATTVAFCLAYLIAGSFVLGLIKGGSQFGESKLSTKGNPYPDPFKDSFLNSCTEGKTVSKEDCQCVLNYLQDNYSYNEFLKDEEKGRPALNEAVASCKVKAVAK